MYKGRARHKLRTEPRIFLSEFALVCLTVLAPTTLLKMPSILILATTSTKKPTTTTTSTYAAAAIDTAASNFVIHINNGDDEDREQFFFKKMIPEECPFTESYELNLISKTKDLFDLYFCSRHLYASESILILVY